MNLKNIWNEIFAYKPYDNYEFNLPETEALEAQFTTDNQQNSSNKKEQNIFPSLNINKEFLQTKYNLLINSDIILREFTLNARGKQYNAFLIYIDGMVDSKIMDDFILKPLILRNKSNLFDSSQNRVVSEAVTNNITVRKVKKFDLSSYLVSCLLPQNSIEEITSFDDVATGINSRKLCSFCRYIINCI